MEYIRWWNILRRVSRVENSLEDRIPYNDVVNCETCGCMVAIDKAIYGSAEVRNPYSPSEAHSARLSAQLVRAHDYIYYPTYCKRCDREGRERKV
jgi:hypothetical protein